MGHQARTAGGIEIVPLCDAVGPMGPSLRKPLPETFPGSRAEDFAEDVWVLHFHCYLLRDRRGRTVLVDTGIGDAGSPAASWAPVPGGLAGELARVGVAPADVDTVILTHLHSDHASGAVAGGEAVFGRARHVLQRAEAEAAAGPVREGVLRPLGERVHLVEGDAEVVPGVKVVLAPGHTPGHQVVRVGDVAITGDLVLHPVQLRDPAVTYVYDDDPVRAAATRAELLDRLRAERGVLATAHFAEPFLQLGE
ncbi:glyoxylase-like metal-dependent hydrolase (beta-lactamase superfamily II) [Thermocatellispora tengchongensis]|uniref:Glyoxylase-like metal-dependent hydrolase (Beta-lactamase superfamily II) n=1 Tax=Thermocatellispora tengchongensis TaxID=1073253 RepID=A0A840NVX4_9ACTN|nr:MBL fold metallo-hydrolase [Thermocatellispora tengchongensis]MBB5130959.1 glyoxylase-like metal-dependent hydrolase (beta-lactamase superfamily II) [Thermocatellispora tengchongensis]